MRSQCTTKRNVNDQYAFTDILESIETEQAIHLPDIQSKTSTKYFDFVNQRQVGKDGVQENAFGLMDQSEIIPYSKEKKGKSIDSVLASLYQVISKNKLEEQKTQKKTKKKTKNVTMRELENEF